MASFSNLLKLKPSSASDVNNYRAFLDSNSPVARVETRFLDVITDLVNLSDNPVYNWTNHVGEELSFTFDEKDSRRESGNHHFRTIHQLTSGLFLAVVAPVLLFQFTPSISSRLSIVFLVTLIGFLVKTGITQSGLLPPPEGYDITDDLLIAALYAAFMAILAVTST